MRISKKLTVVAVVVAMLLLEKKLGLDLDAETKMQLVGVVSAYLIGQGVADFGKRAEQV